MNHTDNLNQEVLDALLGKNYKIIGFKEEMINIDHVLTSDDIVYESKWMTLNEAKRCEHDSDLVDILENKKTSSWVYSREDIRRLNYKKYEAYYDTGK
jgi:hypothetical protein